MGLKRSIKKFAWSLSPGLVYRLTSGGKTEFSIALYRGPTPFDLQPASDIDRPILSRRHVTAAPAGTVADPFMVLAGDEWYLFFEFTNQFRGKGEIACATSADLKTWRFRGLVLAEAYHLSYPQVFRWLDDYYMIPETGRSESVRLYRARSFPDRWEHVTDLLTGQRFVDSSILRWDDRWWMFTDSGPDPETPRLSLYHAAELTGPWLEHPASPLVTTDARISRPGGRMIVYDGRPCRFTQNVDGVYGTEVRAFEIVVLDQSSYEERPIGPDPVVGPGNEGWNRHGMHHVDAHRLADGTWMACVDGCVRRDFDEELLPGGPLQS